MGDNCCDEDDEEEVIELNEDSVDFRSQLAGLGIHSCDVTPAGKASNQLSSETITRLLSMKNREAYINELHQMNLCEDCNKFIATPTSLCQKHGHHHPFTKTLAASVGEQQKQKIANQKFTSELPKDIT